MIEDDHTSARIKVPKFSAKVSSSSVRVTKQKTQENWSYHIKSGRLENNACVLVKKVKKQTGYSLWKKELKEHQNDPVHQGHACSWKNLTDDQRQVILVSL